MTSRFRALAVALAVWRIGIAGVRSAGRRLHRKRMAEGSAARPRAGAAHGRLRAGLQPHPAGRSGAAARDRGERRHRAVRPGRRRRRGAARARRGALRSGGRVVAALRHRRRARRRSRSRRADAAVDPARALRRHAAALPRLEQAGRRRRRFHEHRFQQFRLRRRGQSRPDGGDSRPIWSKPVRSADRRHIPPPPP